MSIKIHHGPPGSYKTAGAMGDDFLREARAGRVIVTNVRGVSRARTLDEFPDLPDTFDVIQVGDKTEEERIKWAQWFHWVPKGAFIFIDEVQDIWPKSWRPADLIALDYPGGVTQAGLDDRPKDWNQAFDKHRHWNWDLVLTTPSYKKVRDDVKGAAEGAYKHKNLALIGINGRYIEGFHMADDDGGAASQFLSVNQKKVPPYVFKLYDSTATGQITDTKSGLSLFKNPRVAILLTVLLLVGGFIISRPVPKVLGGSGEPLLSSSAKTSGAAPVAGAASPAPVAGGNADSGGFAQVPELEPMSAGDPHIVMSVRTASAWKYIVSFNGQQVTNTDLLDMGYTLSSRGHCGLLVTREKFTRFLTCTGQAVAKGEAERSTSPPQPVPELASLTVPPGALVPPY